MVEENKDFKLINAAFPHIGKKLALFWGEPEFNPLMDDLQHDNRGGQREGFPGYVLMALYRLAVAHDHAYPKLACVEKDFWNLSKAR